METLPVPIAITETSEESLPSLSPFAKKGIPLEDIIEFRDKGLSEQQVADLVGCSKANVHERLVTAGYNTKRLKNFIKNRAAMFAHIQSQLLNSLTPEAINDMYPHQRVLCSAILYDKERLERGKSTSNINIAEVHGNIADLQKQAAELLKTL